MKTIIVLFVALSCSMFAQIDTSVWYPSAIGNYWEYQDSGLYVKTGITIIGETVMPNGKTYQAFSIRDLLYNQTWIQYRRVENNAQVYVWNGTNEYKLYDFSQGIFITWRLDDYLNRRIVKRDNAWLQLFQTTLPRIEFEDIYISLNNDTIYIERKWEQIYKGVGEVTLGEWGGHISLVGAIINGQTYGVITSAKDDKNIPSSFSLSQNYPNPFNPTTQIRFSIPNAGLVTLKVYNTLGQEVAVLVDGYRNEGNHIVEFNASKLVSGIYAKGGYASGVYLYRIVSGGFSETKKMTLIR